MSEPPESWDDDVTSVTARPGAAIRRAAHACLTVLTGTAPGQRFRIPEDGCVIGRAPNAEVRIIDDGVSRRHARVFRDGVTILVDDLGSRNGTFLNGARVEGPAALEEGDKIQVGPTVVLRFAHHDEIDERFHESMVAAALRDPLTRLFNKSYLLARLDTELRFARRHEAPLSLLMLDVDHFGALNDRHGTLAGDAVLANLATVIGGAVRNEDIVARFGGDEIAVVLRAIGLDQALGLGERLRRLVEQTPAQARGQELHATISIGAAGCPSTRAEALDRLLEAADQALYRAKGGGRNRVSR
jgi:diguanylate cyclase (GGDEF)-like protein